jgi:hypothetical protein
MNHPCDDVMDTMSGQSAITEFLPDLFLSHVGELFPWVRPGVAGEEKVWMRLVEVTRLPSYGEGRREPFSLLFVLQDQRELQSGLHTLAHPSFECCELLLSRVTLPAADERKEPNSIYYEAVFG